MLEFEGIKEIYEKLEDGKLTEMKYPDCSSNEPILQSELPFQKVNAILIEKGLSNDYDRNTSVKMDKVLANVKGFDDFKTYREAKWNHLREVFNNNFSNLEYIKKKYLRSLNDNLYKNYFENVLKIVRPFLETRTGAMLYEDFTELYIHFITTILGGKYNVMAAYLSHEEFKQMICQTIILDVEDYFKKSGPKKVQAEDQFLQMIGGLQYIRLEIAEKESMLQTIGGLEFSAFDIPVNYTRDIPPYEVPEYEDQLKFGEILEPSKTKQEDLLTDVKLPDVLSKRLVYSKYWELMKSKADREESRVLTIEYLNRIGSTVEEIKDIGVPIDEPERFFRNSYNNRKR